MLRFNNDYSEGAHPRILQALSDTNFIQHPGYGEDDICRLAAESICGHLHSEDAARAKVHFLVGGTQTNQIVIAAALRPHQAVLCAETGHIQIHETGAVEATGHKVLTLPSADGKITAEQVNAAMDVYTDCHMVQPKMVYISHPTELGTLYTKEELVALKEVCKAHGLYLFLDGARLAYGLAVPDSPQLADIAACCDVFYIGGTKCGALFGEAVVILSSTLQQDFRYLIKQHGAMLAKGWLLGLQFEQLFQDNLYFDLGRHGTELAMKFKQAVSKVGYSFLLDSPTNQQFVILPNELLDKLSADFTYEVQEKVSATHTAVRFCFSWATKEENVDKLIGAIV